MSIRFVVLAVLAVAASAAASTTMATSAASTAAATMAPTAASTAAATMAPTAASTAAATMAPTAASTAAATMAPTTAAATPTMAATTAAATTPTMAATTAAATTPTMAATTAAATTPTMAATTMAATSSMASATAMPTSSAAPPSACAVALGTLAFNADFQAANAIFNATNYACNTKQSLDPRDCKDGLAAFTAACEGITAGNLMCAFSINTKITYTGTTTQEDVKAKTYQCTPTACQTDAGKAEQSAIIIAYSEVAAVDGSGGFVSAATATIEKLQCGNLGNSSTTAPPDTGSAPLVVASTAGLLSTVVAFLF